MAIYTKEITPSTFTLAGCGGGGGGGGDNTPVVSTENFALQQAWVGYLYESNSYSYAVSGSYQGLPVTGSGTLTNGNVTTGTFEGVGALQRSQTVTGSISVSGQAVPLAGTSTTFFDSNYNLLGFSYVGGDYSVVTSYKSIPVIGKVGDTDTWYNLTDYTDSSKTSIISTSTMSYVIEPDTSLTAILKIIETVSDGTVNTVSFRMTTNGQLTRLTETTVDSSIPFTLTIIY